MDPPAEIGGQFQEVEDRFRLLDAVSDLQPVEDHFVRGRKKKDNRAAGVPTHRDRASALSGHKKERKRSKAGTVGSGRGPPKADLEDGFQRGPDAEEEKAQRELAHLSPRRFAVDRGGHRKGEGR